MRFIDFSFLFGNQLMALVTSFQAFENSNQNISILLKYLYFVNNAYILVM
jgi:hypothetical protein